MASDPCVCDGRLVFARGRVVCAYAPPVICDGCRVTAEQICAIVALACERPSESERPVTHWSQQDLADEAIKRGIVERVSQRSVGRFLKKNRISSRIVSAFG